MPVRSRSTGEDYISITLLAIFLCKKLKVIRYGTSSTTKSPSRPARNTSIRRMDALEAFRRTFQRTQNIMIYTL